MSKEPVRRQKAEDDEEAVAHAAGTRILEVALDLFETHGFDGVSTDQVAQQASVSKSTVYKLFSCKDDLLVACIEHGCRRDLASVELPEGLERETPSEALLIAARRFIDTFWSERALRLLRLVISELRRSPKIGAAFFETGPRQTDRMLAGYMAGAMARGELRQADPEARAREFMALLMGTGQMELLLQLRQRSTAAERDARARAAVAFFMAGAASPSKAAR